jgi:RNA polymerase sigma-70 factor (ECF subfamily)
VEAFLAALDPALRETYRAYAGLEAALAQLVAAANDPQLDVARFLGDVAIRVETDAPPEVALGSVRAADLALATACARGETEALARFDRELGGQIATAFARHRGAPITLDELRQAMRDRLFVASSDAAPRIASYLGRGDLKAWVRMATVRYLLDVVRADAARPERPGGDEALADLAIAGDDPELAFLKRQYREDFRAAFRDVLTTLDARDRNILRHRYLDGLEVGEIATIYGMHRVSMSRVLGRIRDELLAGIRREFLKRLGIGAEELDGIMALIGSQLELSLSGLLRR